MTGWRLGALIVAAASIAAPAAAQRPSALSLELGAAYRTADDNLLAPIVNSANATVYFRGLGVGVGLDAQARYASGRWSLGAAVQHTFHGLDNVGEHLRFTTVGLEPRGAVPVGSATVYVSGQIALVSYHVASGGDEQSAHGTAFGGGAGLLVPFWPTVELRVAAAYTRASLGDANLTGFTIQRSPRHGSMLSLQTGLAVRLGGGH
jgi:Outer membrane protein beta-barrel domain